MCEAGTGVVLRLLFMYSACDFLSPLKNSSIMRTCSRLCFLVAVVPKGRTPRVLARKQQLFILLNDFHRNFGSKSSSVCSRYFESIHVVQALNTLCCAFQAPCRSRTLLVERPTIREAEKERATSAAKISRFARSQFLSTLCLFCRNPTATLYSNTSALLTKRLQN